MRNRAARLMLVVALAAGAAMAGAAVPHWGTRATMHHLSRVAAVPTSASAKATLAHAPGRATVGTGAAAMGAILAPVLLLAMGMLLWSRRVRVAAPHVAAIERGGGCRAPPTGRL